MKKIIIFTLLAFALSSLNAQKKLDINYASIKETVSNENTYKDLLKRCEANDTTLNDKDYSILYFGQLFQKSYNPYATSEKSTIIKSLKAKEYEKAFELCKKVLQTNPVSLYAMEYLYSAGKALGKPEPELKNYATRYWKLLKMIASTGDGQGKETAFHVISVDDEYHLMNKYFEVEGFKQQSLVNSDKNSYDLMEFTSSNYYKGTKMYFDITQIFMILNNSFK